MGHSIKGITHIIGGTMTEQESVWNLGDARNFRDATRAHFGDPPPRDDPDWQWYQNQMYDICKAICRTHHAFEPSKVLDNGPQDASIGPKVLEDLVIDTVLGMVARGMTTAKAFIPMSRQKKAS